MADINIKYPNYRTILDTVKDYLSPKAKITQLIKNGKLSRIKRNLYINPDDNSVSLNTLANIIYSPSYISFEYALSFYGMIPERVEIISSAVYNKKKNKIFSTPLGTFEYRYVNNNIYPYGIIRVSEKENSFLIASKEKALCDTLSKIASVESVKQMSYLLYDDLRIDKENILNLNYEDIIFFSEIYYQKNIKLLKKLLYKEKKNAWCNRKYV